MTAVFLASNVLYTMKVLLDIYYEKDPSKRVEISREYEIFFNDIYLTIDSLTLLLLNPNLESDDKRMKSLQSLASQNDNLEALFRSNPVIWKRLKEYKMKSQHDEFLDRNYCLEDQMLIVKHLAENSKLFDMGRGWSLALKLAERNPAVKYAVEVIETKKVTNPLLEELESRYSNEEDRLRIKEFAKELAAKLIYFHKKRL